ncbi:hypothetical protein IJ843_05855 [bacterium]|nr:hypothetical protein [bacterium]
MGIIGVVAALTLPNLNSSTGDKEKVAKVKKIYSNLEDAYGRATAVYGPFDTWFINDTDNEAWVNRVSERMTEFMKISKDCGTSTGCFDLSGKSISNIPIRYSNKRSYTLADGTGIIFSYNVVSSVYTIGIDIDGVNKGVNKYGKDCFGFYINENGIEPSGTLGPGPLFSTFADGWTKWVVEIGNMEYLNVDSTGKCKNNTSIILDGVSNITCK